MMDEDREIKTCDFGNDYMSVKPTTLSVELPCGYLKDGELYDYIIVKEMDGECEELLVGKGPILPRMNQIIKICTVSFGNVDDRDKISEMVNEMTASDRLSTLIAIRRISLGDDYRIITECPNKECGEQVRFNLKLNEVKNIRMKDPYIRDREDTIASGRKIKWHIMGHKDEEWLTSKIKKKENILTLAMIARIDSIDIDDNGGFINYEIDRENNIKEVMNVLTKRISMADRQEIRRLFKEKEGMVDTDFDFLCPTCGNEWDGELSVGSPGFFFPSGK